MRSARSSNRLSLGGGSVTDGGSGPGAGSGDRLADPDGKHSNGEGNYRYSHERMLELFKTRDVATEAFAGSEHVYSEHPLAPVSLTELSSKEYELLSGSINSSASKRYSSSQQQTQSTSRPQQQNQQQQHHHHHHHQQQQQSGHGYARNNNAHRVSNQGLNNNAWAKLRDPLARAGGSGAISSGADYEAFGEISTSSANALSSLDQLAHDDGNSAWLRQPIVRDDVGSFGADGVFRMGDDDGSGGGDFLEAPSSRESMLVGARTATSNYSSRAVSPIASSLYSASGAPP
ncbi:hypothetical protein GGI21_005984, partial [Coemansia aciculifera]